VKSAGPYEQCSPRSGEWAGEGSRESDEFALVHTGKEIRSGAGLGEPPGSSGNHPHACRGGGTIHLVTMTMVALRRQGTWSASWAPWLSKHRLKHVGSK
jgi:hypothetical protein